MHELVENIIAIVATISAVLLAVERFLAARRKDAAAGIAVKGVEEAVEVAREAAQALEAGGHRQWSLQVARKADEVKERARQRSMAQGVDRDLARVVERETKG